MPQHRGDPVQHVRVAHLVQVVQDEHQRLRQLGQPAEGALHLRRSERMPQRQSAEPAVRRHPGAARRREQAGPEHDRVVVVGVQRQPGHRVRGRSRGRPLRRQHGLAPPGPGADQRDALLDAGGQQVQQAAPDDQPRREVGESQLGLDDITGVHGERRVRAVS
jgi:hypothetical protein